jgi:hypothetical protein
MYVTDSVFCKSRWNPNTGMPVVSASYKYNTVQPLVWGPMFYVTTGGYRAYRAQLAISGDSDRLVDNPTGPAVNVFLYRWVDENNDGLVNGAELILEASAFKSNFEQQDSSGKPFTVQLNNVRTTRLVPRVQANSWYFLAAELENAFALGADNETNFFTRNYLSVHADSSATSKVEYWAPNVSEKLQNPDYKIFADTLSNIPFINKSVTRSENIAYKTLTGLVPAMALHLSRQLPTVIENENPSPFTKLDVYPNPASDQINLNIGVNAQANTSVSIVSNLGQSVYFRVFRGYNGGIVTIPTTNMPAGTYHVVVSTDKGSEARTITVVHN